MLISVVDLLRWPRLERRISIELDRRGFVDVCQAELEDVALGAQNSIVVAVLGPLGHVADAEAADVILAAGADQNGVEVAEADRALVLEFFLFLLILAGVEILHKHVLLVDVRLDADLVALPDVRVIKGVLYASPLLPLFLSEAAVQLELIGPGAVVIKDRLLDRVACHAPPVGVARLYRRLLRLLPRRVWHRVEQALMEGHRWRAVALLRICFGQEVLSLRNLRVTPLAKEGRRHLRSHSRRLEAARFGFQAGGSSLPGDDRVYANSKKSVRAITNI